LTIYTESICSYYTAADYFTIDIQMRFCSQSDFDKVFRVLNVIKLFDQYRTFMRAQRFILQKRS